MYQDVGLYYTKKMDYIHNTFRTLSPYNNNYDCSQSTRNSHNPHRPKDLLFGLYMGPSIYPPRTSAPPRAKRTRKHTKRREAACHTHRARLYTHATNRIYFRVFY